MKNVLKRVRLLLNALSLKTYDDPSKITLSHHSKSGQCSVSCSSLGTNNAIFVTDEIPVLRAI